MTFKNSAVFKTGHEEIQSRRSIAFRGFFGWKPIGNVFDLTLVLADMGEKALAQVKRGAVELLTPRMDQAAAEALADKLAGGHWTHDYALTATEARELGLPVKVGMPQEVLALMKLYPQPVQQSGIEYLPIDLPRQRRV